MSPGTRRTLLFSLVALVAGGVLVLALSDALTLEQLKARREELVAFIAARPITVTALLFAAFVILATFAPGAAVLKVAAGALFGLLGGFVFGLLATLIAATCGFLLARYVARGWVERRFHQRVEVINRGVQREGVAFLLALRLNPLIPFFLINAGMGLTRMRGWVFVVTSFFGLLPACFIYTNAGTELARIETPSDILSFRLLGSLILLSLMPLAGRWAARKLRRGGGSIAERPGRS